MHIVVIVIMAILVAPFVPVALLGLFVAYRVDAVLDDLCESDHHDVANYVLGGGLILSSIVFWQPLQKSLSPYSQGSIEPWVWIGIAVLISSVGGGLIYRGKTRWQPW